MLETIKKRLNEYGLFGCVAKQQPGVSGSSSIKFFFMASNQMPHGALYCKKAVYNTENLNNQTTVGARVW